MPVISRFYGMIIRMYYLQAEHNPPHIHVIYSEDTASVDIQTGEVLDGYLPTKSMQLLREWLNDNKDQLLDMWKTQKYSKLPPLE